MKAGWWDAHLALRDLAMSILRDICDEGLFHWSWRLELYNERNPSEIFSSEFWYRFLWDFTSILKAIAVLLLLHFDSCSAKAIMIWLTNQMKTLSNKSLSGVLWIVWPKKVRTFLRKCQRWRSVSVKLQGKVFKTGLRQGSSLWVFPILEKPFCRAHASISFRPLDYFLVFNREALLFSLSELATHRSPKQQLIRNFSEKEFIGNVPF